MGRTQNCKNLSSLGRLVLLGSLATAASLNLGRAAWAQSAPVSAPSSSPASGSAPQATGGVGAPAEDSGSGIGAIAGGVTNGFPDLFRRRMLFRFSLGEYYSTGVSDQYRTNASDFSTTASASLSYNWQRRRSDYGFSYTASAHRYGRLQSVGAAVRHNLGVTQTLQLGPRTTWGFSHHFSLTPDYGDDLLRDTVVEQFSFVNPLPRFGTVDPLANPNNLPTSLSSIPVLNPLPDLGSPSPTFVGPPEASVPFRSFRTTNSSNAQLSHALTARTNLSLGAGYSRLRYRDRDYFGRDHVGFSASLGRMLTARTSLNFGYFGGRLEQPGGFDLTWSHGGRISLSHQLSPSVQLSIGWGPIWVRSTGQQAIPLSPVLANLLGTPTLLRDTSLSFLSLGWNGTVGFSKQWERTHFGIGYSRGVSALNALSSVSRSESASLTLGRQIGRVASVSGSASYGRHDFIALRDVGRFDQASATLSVSRRLTSTMDLSLFANYSKLLTSSRGTAYEGHGRFGINFVFHFPRVGVE